MKKYDHRAIEQRWQREWEKKGIYRSREKKGKGKHYVLDMFPYPSGEGLHVGHPKGYIATDILSRYKRMHGESVLHPMGWDAFGLPAENFAIKNKIHPKKAVAKNIARFKKQLSMIGLDYDWSREINTTDPAYYKWTQWIFLKLLERGLAYESNEPINWCPTCQTGLSNEDLDGNQCERCGTIVEKRPMRQWMLRITQYAERLLNDLELLPKWQEHIKESQRNWIGRSEGAEIDFPLVFEEASRATPNFLLLHGYKGSPSGSFHQWLKSELERRGYEVQVPELPNSAFPKEKEQVQAVLGSCKIDEKTILVGHSLGGGIALRIVETLGKKVGGLVLVGSVVNAKFPGAKKRPFWADFNWDFDYERIQRLAGFTTVLSDLQEGALRVPYLQYLASRLGARLIEGNAAKLHFVAREEPMVLKAVLPHITVFTTRPDTLFGATYMVLSPEHPWVRRALEAGTILKNSEEVKRYVAASAKKTEIERLAENKEKTGVQLQGVTAINPATGSKIPVFIADYVLAHYGTGAIMAVPAHDERDHAFAKKFGIPVIEVIEPLVVRKIGADAVREEPYTERQAVFAFVKHWSEDKYLGVTYKPTSVNESVTGGIEEGEHPEEAGKREILEETGYEHAKLIRALNGHIHGKYYSVERRKNIFSHFTVLLYQLEDGAKREVAEHERSRHDVFWLTEKEMTDFINREDIAIAWARLRSEIAYTGGGLLVRSGSFDGRESEEVRSEMAHTYGREKITYKLRDWVFSRQRYWGEPIPVIHCPKCGVVPVPENELPVKLPQVASYQPTGTGESPLSNIATWVNVKCPRCKGPGKRETNTMPQWAGSSWYYLRYMDPGNTKAIVDPKKEKYWAPVNTYVGGAEHATRHLIYARFWHKFLEDIGVVHTKEPFDRLISVGLILAEDGRKMSKRYGNTINPDDVVKTYGADTLRTYEMFMGPFTDSIAWSTESMIGARRFLERAWRLSEKLSKTSATATERALHKMIRKVGDDVEAFKFNTAISTMMIFLNVAEKEGVSRDQYRKFLQVLAPFAPHMTEELWTVLGGKSSIHVSTWPKYDAKKGADDEVTIAIQIDGKVRGETRIAANAPKEVVEEAAKTAVSDKLKGQKIARAIVVPGRLVNFVLER